MPPSKGRLGGRTASREIALRHASGADADLLLGWANDPATREASLSRRPISRPEHLAWLAGILADPSRRLWIGTLAGTPVGQVRIEASSGAAGVVSISLASPARGRGLSRPLLERALAAATAELATARFRALVREGNTASRRLFEGAGFLPVARDAAPDGEVVIVYER